jgi:hypothetical protein
MTGKLYPESLRILTEIVSRRGMPDDVPRTWILTRRDRALAPKLQRKYIEAIGGVQTLIEIETCHCLMVSEPKRLAQSSSIAANCAPKSRGERGRALTPARAGLGYAVRRPSVAVAVCERSARATRYAATARRGRCVPPIRDALA